MSHLGVAQVLLDGALGCRGQLRASAEGRHAGDMPLEVLRNLVGANGGRHGRRPPEGALAAASSGFRRSLPPGIVGPLADLVRAMNCYYSNLIEGHNTHPIDMERALKGD